jgi:hypothetical protein
MKHVDIAGFARDGVGNALLKLTGKRYRTRRGEVVDENCVVGVDVCQHARAESIAKRWMRFNAV